MSEDINRDGTVNAIGWLAEEQAEANRKAEKSKLSAEIIKLKLEKEKQESIALYEMYNAVARCGEDCYCSSYGKRICHLATAMVHLCYKLKYINKETYKKLNEYLELRLKKYEKKL